MKKIVSGYFIVLVIVCVGLFAFDVFAMTLDAQEKTQPVGSTVKVKRNSVVYLLSWQGDKLVTTNGTFYLSSDIKIVNQTGLKKEDVARLQNKPIVQFSKVGRQIKTVTILSNTQ